jgi:DNA-binding transcriptional MocR family regulator
MKYKKGTFVVVPNVQFLKERNPEMLSVYFWLCVHCNDDGMCFPTKGTLCKETGLSHNTLTKYLKLLINEGFIICEQRKTKNGRNTSNMYYLQLMEGMESSVGVGIPPSSGSQTIPSINYTNLTIIQPEVVPVIFTPFSLEDELKKLWESTWKPNKIIALYLTAKKMTFDNKKQFDATVSRNLKPAKFLQGYSSDQIEQTMEYCEKNYSEFGWTMETLVKRIALLVNIK